MNRHLYFKVWKAFNSIIIAVINIILFYQVLNEVLFDALANYL